MWWFTGHSDLQCFTNGTLFNYYWWAATGELLDCMEVLPEVTPGTVPDAATGELLDCMEVLPEETPGTVPDIRLWDQGAAETTKNKFKLC